MPARSRIHRSRRRAQLRPGVPVPLRSRRLKDPRRRLGWAGLLHDIGKVAVPTEILRKPGRLNAVEWEEVKRHPVIGADIVLSVGDRLMPLAEAIRAHHEWFGGSGYPDGLAGDQIPLFGRLIAVVDVYDSLTADRPYRPHPFTPRDDLE